LLHKEEKILNRYGFVVEKMRVKLLNKLKNDFYNIDIRLGEGFVSEQQQSSGNSNNNEETKEEKKEESVQLSTDNQRYLEGRRTITTTKGNSIECDLVFYCNGTSVSRFNDETFLKDCINSSNGRIRVKKTMQIEKSDSSHIFALGDCADGADQFSYIASAQAEVVVHNVRALEKEERL